MKLKLYIHQVHHDDVAVLRACSDFFKQIYYFLPPMVDLLMVVVPMLLSAVTASGAMELCDGLANY